MRPDRNTRTLIGLSGVAVLMVGAAYASVPLYDWFCRVTGFGGTTQVAEANAREVLDREVTIRFAGNLARGMPWRFRPVEPSMEVKIGETALAFFTATNPTDRRIAGTASYNVTPLSTGGYFSKIDCFCFDLQVLEPGETVQMPVTFYVDPEIMADPEARLAHTITLSYTFHETDPPEEEMAAAN